MPFTIPDEQTATFPAQSLIDATDFAAVCSSVGTVVSGCATTAKTPATMHVKVAAGTVLVNGTVADVTAHTTVTIGTATSHDRQDIITVNSSGTVTVTAGTECSVATWTTSSGSTPPRKPAIPATQVLIATVYVKGSASSIASTAITDKRVIAPIGVTSITTYTSSQTVKLPPGSYKLVLISGSGGGASGAAPHSTKTLTTGGGGGGAGGWIERTVTITTTTTFVLTVGAKGTKGAGTTGSGFGKGKNGTNGGGTIVAFGSTTYSITGGVGGKAGLNFVPTSATTVEAKGGKPGGWGGATTVTFAGLPGVGGSAGVGATNAAKREGGAPGQAVDWTGAAGGAGSGLTGAHGGLAGTTSGSAIGHTTTANGQSATSAPAGSHQGGPGGGGAATGGTPGSGGTGDGGSVIIERVS